VEVPTIMVKTKTEVIVIFLIESSLCVMPAAYVDRSFKSRWTHIQPVATLR